jgi:tetratricopeptide (TPR) repeat protein
MSPREKYRTLGVYYLIFVRNYPLAIETLRQLVEQFPADSSGYNNLSIAYVYTRNIPEALKASRHALENNPENLQHRLNFCQYSMYASEYETSIAECGRILKSNPGFEFAYVPVALSKLAQGDVAGSRETYARQEKVNPLGYSFAKAGEGDLEMYMGRYKEAMGPLQQGIDADQKEKSLGMMALKHIAKAEAHLAMGERAQAIEAVRKASQLDPTEFVLYPAARVLIQAGEEGEARTLAKTLDEKLQIQTKSYARLIEGEIALQRKQIPEALEAFRDGQKLLDSWIAHFLLGRAHLEAGQYADGLAELEICLKRRGEATDFLFADTSTLRYLPPLYYWLGRAQEGLGSKDAARASYGTFLKLRSEANPGDPLVDDARRRIGS